MKYFRNTLEVLLVSLFLASIILSNVSSDVLTISSSYKILKITVFNNNITQHNTILQLYKIIHSNSCHLWNYSSNSCLNINTYLNFIFSNYKTNKRLQITLFFLYLCFLCALWLITQNQISKTIFKLPTQPKTKRHQQQKT